MFWSRTNSTLGPVFEIDPDRFAAARARHAGVGDRIRVSFSTDCDCFGSEIGNADVLIGWDFPYRKLGDVAPRLRWVHLTGAGVNHLAPFDWNPPGSCRHRSSRRPRIQSRGVRRACRPDDRQSCAADRHPAGASGVALALLTLHYGHDRRDRRRRQHGGRRSSACKKLGMRVIGTRRGGAPHPQVDRMLGPGELDTLLAESDVVFLCTPLTPETRGLIGASQLAHERWRRPGQYRPGRSRR